MFGGHNVFPEEKVVLDEMPAWKKYARIILPHIGLIILSLLYIVGGAFIFYYLEHPNEVFVRGESLRLIEENRKIMLNHLWLLVTDNSTTREEVENSVIEHVDNASKLLFDAFDTHFIFVVHLPDIGKFLSENIVWLYGLYVDMRKRQPKTSSTENLNEDEEEGHAPETKEFLATMSLQVDIPTSLIAIILLGYMAIGAFLLGMWENWNFFQGFYFSFITMTTVGFGDIVPVKQQFFVFDLFYIIIGLAITTMCIDLVGIQYIRKIHYFGRAIKDARYALVNVGGRMVRVPDLIRLATVLQQKYGQRKRGSFDIWNGAYRPNDLRRIRYIDTSGGASIDSLSSFVSSIFSGNNNKAKEPVRL
uniref:Potassium channel domain-containing protein n=1 Tax=Panagrolaimus davidi TaxID=227884 RepID=A0A914QGG3_9BILA